MSTAANMNGALTSIGWLGLILRSFFRDLFSLKNLLWRKKNLSFAFCVPGMTPLLAAAVTGHIHIVEYLIANADLVSRQERIDALELLGATFVDKKRDMLGSFKLWKRAMEDR